MGGPGKGLHVLSLVWVPCASLLAGPEVEQRDGAQLAHESKKPNYLPDETPAIHLP